MGTILFTRAGGTYGDETVFTARPDGTREQRITPFGTQCCPRWAPDGSSILISALAPDGLRITTGIIRPDGSGERLVPLPDGTIDLGPGAWFADGKRIAFEGWDDARPGRAGIYVARASDGGGLTRLTTALGSDLHDIPMDVAPDGTRVYFFRPVVGFPKIGDVPEGSLFSVRLDGSELIEVTPKGIPVELVGSAAGRVSRDGTRVLFTSAGAIWTVGSDGTRATKVFEDPDGRLAITPTWSPDGRWILFGLDPAGSLATVETAPVNSLYVVAADGTSLTSVVSSGDWKREPEWVAATR